MGNYFTSKKYEKEVECRRAELELLLKFSNADIKLEKNKDLQTDILHRLSHHQALHPDNQYRQPEEKVVGKIINNLQRHLRSRFKDIYTKATTLIWWDDLWPSSASTRFIIDPVQGHFREEFRLQKVKVGNEQNAYKKILDLWLIEINRLLHLIPRRFGQCPRCESFFYTPTEKKKTYCSTNCASAVRIQKFREGRKNKEK